MQKPADVVVRPAIKHVPRSVVGDTQERIVRCGLGIVPISSETEDKFEDAMEVAASSPLFEIARVLVRLDHVPVLIVNPSHSIMRAAAKLRVTRLQVKRAGAILAERYAQSVMQ